METCKQRLLRRHRRNKRILIALPILVALDWLGSWSTVPVTLLLVWIAHEAWFSDHLFYTPREDYQYDFPSCYCGNSR